MTASFADTARRCCALSARLLGWGPGDFWDATPAELAMALADPCGTDETAPPSRDAIARMMERDANG